MDLKETPRGDFHRHPWEASRYRFFRRVLRDAGSETDVRRVLDVGAGDTWFSSQLAESMPTGIEIVCWDTGYEDDQPAAVQARRGSVSIARTQPGIRFDLLLFLDVLEHVDDDLGFLKRIVTECANARAQVLISVPAWPGLVTGRDEALGHHRRYRPDEGRELLDSAGLTILRSGGLFHSLVLLRALAVARERVLGRRRSETVAEFEWRAGRWLGRLAESALAFDNALSRFASTQRAELPGLSWWALCQTS
jgi:hypothetical protein